MELVLKISLITLAIAATMLLAFVVGNGFKSLKNNNFYKLVLIFVIGGFLGFFGLVSGGAGHGPFPKLSAIIMVVGAIMAIFSFVVLIFYSIYLGIKNKSN